MPTETVAAASSAVRPDASLVPVPALGMGRATGTATVPTVVFVATGPALTETVEAAGRAVLTSAQAMMTTHLTTRLLVSTSNAL